MGALMLDVDVDPAPHAADIPALSAESPQQTLRVLQQEAEEL